VFTPFRFEAKEELVREAKKPKEVSESAPGGSFVPALMRDELDKFGALCYKTDPVDLTDADAEFVVSYFVNVFESDIVLEFLCTNTIEGLNISNVSISLEDVDVVETIPAPFIRYQQTASICCVIKRDSPMVFGQFGAVLLYSQEDDENQEEWALEPVILGPSVWLQKARVDQFVERWDELKASEASRVLQIPKVKGVVQGVQKVEQVLGLEKISEEKDAKKTTLGFSGKDLEGSWVLVLAQLGMSKRTVVCRVAVRSKSLEMSEELAQAINF
jgi:hypothetical protein